MNSIKLISANLAKKWAALLLLGWVYKGTDRVCTDDVLTDWPSDGLIVEDRLPRQ